MSGITFTLPLNNHIYKITPNIHVIFEIEDELGSIKALEQRFLNNTWSTHDLVTCVHILLSAHNVQIDFMTLGHRMMTEGFKKYHTLLTQFLSGLMA